MQTDEFLPHLVGAVRVPGLARHLDGEGHQQQHLVLVAPGSGGGVLDDGGGVHRLGGEIHHAQGQPRAVRDIAGFLDPGHGLGQRLALQSAGELLDAFGDLLAR